MLKTPAPYLKNKIELIFEEYVIEGVIGKTVFKVKHNGMLVDTLESDAGKIPFSILKSFAEKVEGI